MLEIFHVARSRSMRVVWLAEEMGLPYTVRKETLFQPSPPFLQANPVGSLPAIVDGDVAMGESTAIMLYLIERYGPTPVGRRCGDPDYGAFLQHLIAGEGSMAAFLNPALMTRFITPDSGPNVTLDHTRAAFLRRVATLEAALAGRDHLLGEFTAADISVGYALGLGDFLGIADGYPVAVKAYHARLLERPAYQAAAAA